jgi:hypothetical protein
MSASDPRASRAQALPGAGGSSASACDPSQRLWSSRCGAHRGTAADQLALELSKATQVRQHQPAVQPWSCRPRCPAVI